MNTANSVTANDARVPLRNTTEGPFVPRGTTSALQPSPAF
jgi:hypothetical protein